MAIAVLIVDAVARGEMDLLESRYGDEADVENRSGREASNSAALRSGRVGWMSRKGSAAMGGFAWRKRRNERVSIV